MAISRYRWHAGMIQIAQTFAVPIGIAICSIAVWHFVFFLPRFGLPEQVGTDQGMYMIMIQAIWVIYGVLASFVINRLWEKRYQLRKARVLDDRTLRQVSEMKIPLVIHTLMVAISLLIMALVMLYPYTLWIYGAVSVAASSFILSLFLMVALTLNDPKNEAWDPEPPHGSDQQDQERITTARTY